MSGDSTRASFFLVLLMLTASTTGFLSANDGELKSHSNDISYSSISQIQSGNLSALVQGFTGESEIHDLTFSGLNEYASRSFQLSDGSFIVLTTNSTYNSYKLNHLFSNYTVDWSIDLWGWYLEAIDVHETNTTFFVTRTGINSNEITFNPFGNSQDIVRVVSLDINGNVRHWTNFQSFTTQNPSFGGQDYSADSQVKFLQNGGFIIGGTETGNIEINGSIIASTNTRINYRTNTAPPNFYECYNPYHVEAVWFSVYSPLGQRESFSMTNGNYGAIFGGFATNPYNGSIHVHFEAQQRNQNPCDSGSSSWTWNGTTFSSDNPTTLILNQLGEVIGGQDVGFPFDELDDLVAWGPVLNETYVGFWDTDSLQWNSSHTINGPSAGFGTIHTYESAGELLSNYSVFPTGGIGVYPGGYQSIQYHTNSDGTLLVVGHAEGLVDGINVPNRNTGEGNTIMCISKTGDILWFNHFEIESTTGQTYSRGFSSFHTKNDSLIILQKSGTYSGQHLPPPSTNQFDSYFIEFSNDSDGDFLADEQDPFPNEATQWSDLDSDGFGDNPNGNNSDDCLLIYGLSYRDRNGCEDNDGDGTSNLNDRFPNLNSQWNDSDSDGYGDNVLGYQYDSCPNTFGESNRNGTFGCVDQDFDGWADIEDVFPYDSSQWSDWDGDGFGDELIGYEGDACPSQYGNSTIDRFGCLDFDGDGYSDLNDDFVSNPTQNLDTDGDGYGNNQTAGATMSDAFPYDGTQWNDTDGDGYGDNPYGNQGDKFPNDPTKWQDSDDDGYADEDDAFVNDATQWNDTDGDGYGDEANGNRPDAFPNDPLEWQDSDGDGYGNNGDSFPVDGTQWNDTDGDGHGDNPYGTQGDWFPNDPNRWQDSDLDGYADEDDAFINDATQWNDTDGDGYGDEANGNRADEFPNDPLEWQDSDGDGYGNNADAFPVDGTQWNDTDGDGYGDNPYGTQGDWFPNDPNRWKDSDQDGYADEDDLFPNDISQWNDTDGDGYGDNINGTNGDVFPDDSNEWKDSDEDGVGNNADQYPYDPTQTVDSDGDGYGDNINGNRGDVFPQDGTEWSDIDNDGYGDNTDLFLTDGTQWNDTDGDGFGDNLNGANGDACPLISGNSSIILLGCVDTDGDGYADQIDAFISDALSWSDVDGDSVPDELDAYPNDATQSLDSDGDGFGDNPLGTNADKFPNDTTQWNDIDGDGFGDNLDGNNPDLFITDGTQWADSDGDGYGDNPQGRLYDMFPDNPTQWLDEDGDGLGDNQSGTDADPYLDDFDNDGYNDSIDILPKLASPGDLDADGCLDEVDNFTADPTECIDTDGDGVGNNADSDDDGDGWTDADEIRLNTDSLSSSSQPVDSFEIVIPGTAVGLGAWDLIGIFGGVPLFAWLAFGFATRNGRCQKYEDLLNQATSRDELEQVALRWEYSLMLRMLGPHQGIRLERLRAELDDRFENSEPEEIGVNQTSIVEREAKELPPIEAKSESTPSKDTPATSTDNDGYEWLKDESGIDWYRAAGSGDEWAKFES